MNIIKRLNYLEEKAALLESNHDTSSSIMFNDNGRLYHYEMIDGKSVKVYPTQEELDKYQGNHKRPIITFHACLDQEKLLI